MPRSIFCQETVDYRETGLYVAVGDFCGYPTFYRVENGSVVPGQCFVFNDQTCNFQEIPVGTTVVPYTPSIDKQCFSAQVNVAELAAGTSDTVLNLADAQIAALGLTFDVPGKAPIPVTSAELVFVSLVPKPCGTQDSAGNDVTIDYVTVDGNDLSAYTDDELGGVSDAQVDVPAGACSLATMCFKLCLSKQEIAALP